MNIGNSAACVLAYTCSMYALEGNAYAASQTCKCAPARLASPSSALAACREQVELQSDEAALGAANATLAEVVSQLEALEAAEDALGPRGVPGFLLEGALLQLSACAAGHLEGLAPGMRLELSATAPTAAAAGGAKASAAARDAERIYRVRRSAAGPGARCCCPWLHKFVLHWACTCVPTGLLRWHCACMLPPCCGVGREPRPAVLLHCGMRRSVCSSPRLCSVLCLLY
jgi:hypothetical protein